MPAGRIYLLGRGTPGGYLSTKCVGALLYILNRYLGSRSRTTSNILFLARVFAAGASFLEMDIASHYGLADIDVVGLRPVASVLD